MGISFSEKHSPKEVKIKIPKISSNINNFFISYPFYLILIS